jgi:hypothetical protein
MIIRSYAPTDLDQLKEIHEKHFKEEFDLPNFLRNYYCAFTVENDDRIVTIGGVRPIAEAITCTNKTLHTREKVRALYEILSASAFIAQQNGHSQLHCFVQNEQYAKQLIRNGFRDTKGRSLVMDV